MKVPAVAPTIVKISFNFGMTIANAMIKKYKTIVIITKILSLMYSLIFTLSSSLSFLQQFLMHYNIEFT